MPNFLSINTILVPQGAEYKAVCRGLRGGNGSMPTVGAIPVGMKPLLKYLQQAQVLAPKSRVLIMGICGSLSDRYPVGDIVLYQDCVYQGKRQECDRTFTTQLHSYIPEKVSLVKSLTSDRVIWSAAEKRHLGETLAADVVDMEGFTALEFFNAIGVAVAMVRVVSDNCQHDIPNLTSAINSDGSLNPFPLAMGMLRQPLAATRLIRGSLTALKTLEQVTNLLFSGNQLG
ncbi:phosphorylase family protein [Nostoc sp. 'Peltigera membranacea cyanobiont' N6]|uniref:phosphorylase family protein n=1 Tax=Nostoc sp. 'Peltigera membranacea cyanobiont' N6 TaxID=1261031 RepID=UPI000CF35D24|nr:phosphorylase [Nostoc sp. 'Peltigera membranacea cyanobiont' N6]AVH65843.1 hopanoid-associated phosphorylase HpnG [Nostoc sp. 'Peltigera membranacea cyanobiont' N6]